MSLFSRAELSYAASSLSASSSGGPDPSRKPQAAPPLPDFVRSDGRPPSAYRDLSITTRVAEGAIGSARVSVSGGLGGTTEVWAGVRGEIEDIQPRDSFGNGARGPSESQGKIVITVEGAPTALPLLKAELLQHLYALLESLFSSASLPPSFLSQLVVLPSLKAWTLYVDLLILSATGGNVIDISVMAVRSALAATRIPKTQSIVYDVEASSRPPPSSNVLPKPTTTAEGDDSDMAADILPSTGMPLDTGMTGLLKGGISGSKAIDFELVDGSGGWEDGERLKGWEELPVAVTLNVINQKTFLDGTVLEEAASDVQLIFGFNLQGDLCGIKQIGEGEIEWGRMMSYTREAQACALELAHTMNVQLKDS